MRFRLLLKRNNYINDKMIDETNILDEYESVEYLDEDDIRRMYQKGIQGETLSKKVLNFFIRSAKYGAESAVAFGTMYGLLVFIYAVSKAHNIRRSMKETKRTMAKFFIPHFINELIETKDRIEKTE